MNTQVLKNILNRDHIAGPEFCGVYAENTLPGHIKTYPCGFIANTDPKNKPGRHWVAFYFPSPEEGEFFDSFGHSPTFYSPYFVRLLNRNCKQWTFNQRKLQSERTAVCGEYCVYYLLHRARGASMNSIVKRFSNNRINNDQKVYEFVLKLLRQ